MTTTPEPATADSFTGGVFGGRYRIDGLIGRGGMATVYRGTDASLGRAVALKVFAATAEGIDDVSRRRSEVALLASVEHRALVRLYDAAHDDASGREYLVMELVDGRDLRETLRSGPVRAADAAGLAADIGEALHVIHSRGIVHRDVKPANVLLEPAHLPTRSWNAKLADFGIARLIDDTRLTRTGLLIGTPGYLSPEQVSGETAGAATDVYALGLVLLEARTGRAAFPGNAAEAASARLVRDPEIPESLGADWVHLLRAMTSREAGDRPTALEVAVAAGRLGDTASVQDADAETVITDAATLAAAVPDDDATAATRVLPTPDATAATRVLTPAPAAEVAGRPTKHRGGGLRPATIVAMLVGVGVVVAAALLLPGAITAMNPDPGTTTEPLPTLPAEFGDLETHLQQLDEAVTR